MCQINSDGSCLLQLNINKFRMTGRRTKAFKGPAQPPIPVENRVPFKRPGVTKRKQSKSATPGTSKSTAPKAPRTKRATKRTPRLTSSRGALDRAFTGNDLPLCGSVTQALDILDGYMKKHLLDAEPIVLREVLRLVHKMLPAGPQKSKIRGTLGKRKNFFDKKKH